MKPKLKETETEEKLSKESFGDSGGLHGRKIKQEKQEDFRNLAYDQYGF